MIDLKNIKAVFFDFGDTLTTTIETYPKRIQLSLEKNGYFYSDIEFINAYLKADYEIFQYYYQNSSIKHSDHQKLLFNFLVNNLKIKEDHLEVMTKVNKTLKNIDFKRIIMPGCIELLEHLKSKNIVLAVISNNDGKTKQKSADLNIKKYFDLILDSTEVRIVKPNIEIFQLALNKLNLKQNEVIHVGDLYGSDILGARNAGINPIWFNHRNSENFNLLDITIIKNLYDLISLFS